MRHLAVDKHHSAKGKEKKNIYGDRRANSSPNTTFSHSIRIFPIVCKLKLRSTVPDARFVVKLDNLKIISWRTRKERRGKEKKRRSRLNFEPGLLLSSRVIGCII